MRTDHWRRRAVAGSAATAIAVVIGVPLLTGRFTAQPHIRSAPVIQAASATATSTATPSLGLSASPRPTPLPTQLPLPDPSGPPDPSMLAAGKASMSTAPGIVLWSPTVYDEKSPTLVPDSVPEPGLTTCAQADVHVSLTEFAGGLTGGGIGGQLQAVARPGRRCLLQGWPTITLRDASWRSISTARLYEPFALPFAIPMQGNEVGAAMIELRGNTSADKIATVDVALPGWPSPLALEYRGEQPHYIDAGNGATAMTWPFSPPNGGELSYSGLRGLIMVPRNLPPDVAPGGELQYELAVIPGLTDVALTPCIGYRESLRDNVTNAVVASEDHVLNCAGVGTIATNTTVR